MTDNPTTSNLKSEGGEKDHFQNGSDFKKRCLIEPRSNETHSVCYIHFKKFLCHIWKGPISPAVLTMVVSEVKDSPVFKTCYKVEYYLYHSSLQFFL